MQKKHAKIYRPAKTAMQSGKGNTQHWLLEFDQTEPRFHDPVMGWVGSSDMTQELRLKFPSKEAAIAYVEAKRIAYEVIEPKPAKMIIRQYADNFK